VAPRRDARRRPRPSEAPMRRLARDNLIGLCAVLAVAILLSQHFIHPRLELLLKNIIELLAAIPSVVYGLWGIYLVIPLIRPRSLTCNRSAFTWLNDWIIASKALAPSQGLAAAWVSLPKNATSRKRQAVL